MNWIIGFSLVVAWLSAEVVDRRRDSRLRQRLDAAERAVRNGSIAQTRDRLDHIENTERNA